MGLAPTSPRRFGILVGVILSFLVAALFGAQWMSTKLLAATYRTRVEKLEVQGWLEPPERVTIPEELGEWFEAILHLDVRGQPMAGMGTKDVDLSFATLLDAPGLEPLRTGTAVAAARGFEALEAVVDALTLRAKQTRVDDARAAAEDLRRALVVARTADDGTGVAHLWSLLLARRTVSAIQAWTAFSGSDVSLALRPDANDVSSVDWIVLADALDAPLAAAAERARLTAPLVAEWRLALGPDDLPEGARGNALAVFERGEAYVRGLQLLDALEATLAAQTLPCDGPGAPERRPDGLLAFGEPERETWLRGVLAVEGHGHSLRRELVLARVALAVAAHHQEVGRWPVDLDDLEGRFEDGVPLDPCTGRPFVYVEGPDWIKLHAEPLPRIRHPANTLVLSAGSSTPPDDGVQPWAWPKR